ncbi:MAG: hypothetical protein LBK23_11720 [Oscillospiraceae bacterium]|nr:hypothetical protein [Oscillospiraceae bacterium]
MPQRKDLTTKRGEGILPISKVARSDGSHTPGKPDNPDKTITRHGDAQRIGVPTF